MRTTLRALLALGLLAGFYLLVTAVVVLDLLFLVRVAPHLEHKGQSYGWLATVVMLASAPLLVGLFFGVFAVSRPNAPIKGSVLVRREQAAELWMTVAELAEQVGTRAPTEIRLIGQANAMVSEKSYLLGLVPGRTRRLYIGAPLLVGLRADEIRAVLCHEFGHYARKHTRLAAIVYRGSASLRATLERLEEVFTSGAGKLAGGYSVGVFVLVASYARLYYWIVSAVNRRQELEADAAAARIVGAEVTAEALRAVQGISASWKAFDSQVLEPMRRSGRLPDDPFSAFRAILEDPCYRDDFARLRRVVCDDPDKPYDTHPGQATRLRALADLPPGVVNPDPRAALDLLPKYQNSFAKVRSRLYTSKPSPMPWRTWLTLAAKSRAVQSAQALKRAETRLAADTELRRPLLAAVLDRLEAGQSRALAQRLDGAPGLTDNEGGKDGRGYPDPLLVALFSLVGQGLVGIGAASWHLSWTGASLLVPREITADELTDLLAAAVRDPLQVPRLRLHLAGLGLNDHAPIALGERDAPQRMRRVVPLIDAAGKRRRRNMSVATIVVTLCIIALVIAETVASMPATS